MTPVNGRLVHFGAEMTCPPEWDNFDCSPTFAFERIPLIGKWQSKNPRRFPKNLRWGDIVKGLPVPDASADAVYCSHVLEHLSLDELRRSLSEVMRITKPGGIFRAVLPDLEYYIEEYRRDASPGAAEKFMYATMLGEPAPWRGIYGFLTYVFGTSKHRWMWDYKGLRAEFERAGFVEIRRASFRDCEEASLREAFVSVEAEGRWTNCLGLQARKPVR